MEAVKAETAPRKVIFTVMTAVSLLSAMFWLQIKTVWPPFTGAMVSVGTNPVAWFVAFMFIFAVLAFHPAKNRQRVVAAPSPSSFDVKSTNTDKPSEGNKKPEEKMVIDISAEYLIDLYRGRTTIQADALMAMYLGKWITVTGKVANVWKSRDGYKMIIFVGGDLTKLVTLDFDLGGNEHVAYLTRDSDITVHGKIESATGTGLEMIECSIK
jgi:hypothetical protein